ncbi:hypothetical protein BV898_08953 [Hypsibius exemplaris]|uniref:Uncharacterized protein n=1 Tax=Hypsibius exemplaris TaxID=2072580 RepID=A0A1W0WP18_HYPEX|nr:hypothetical protein BV898_08953 [Hypsibius exemplaris]
MNSIDEIASRASNFLDETNTPGFRRSLGIAISAVFGKTTGPERGYRLREYRRGQPLSSASARHLRDVILQYQPVFGPYPRP